VCELKYAVDFTTILTIYNALVPSERYHSTYALSQLFYILQSPCWNWNGSMTGSEGRGG
jgi:hypothetical protein